jgi:hypothetical protein
MNHWPIIPPLIERGLYCNHLVRLSVRSHFRNRYLSFYWKKWLHIYFLFTVRLTNERVGVFLAWRSVQHLVGTGTVYKLTCYTLQKTLQYRCITVKCWTEIGQDIMYRQVSVQYNAPLLYTSTRVKKENADLDHWTILWMSNMLIAMREFYTYLIIKKKILQ